MVDPTPPVPPSPGPGRDGPPVRFARIARVEAHVLRWPVRQPVRTSFGTMHDRPALLVRVEDADGAHGWGEAWCNFPSCGAEHRAAIVRSVLAPLVEGTTPADVGETWRELTARTAVLALQSGEPGPFAQAIAGVDLALHDLAARRAGLPLWRWLSTAPPAADAARVAVYASGLNPDGAGEAVERLRGAGWTAFKLKVGFGAERDLANLGDVRRAAGAHAAVMVDANQAWSLAEAEAMAERLAVHAPRWLEEPLRADRPWAEWQALRRTTAIPLAAGENVTGDEGFAALVASGAVSVLQPDVAKWGGLTANAPIVQRALAAGLAWCPHYLGAGVGLLASAHLLAALSPGRGLLEVDANENPLRTLLCPPLARLDAGTVTLDETPGIGVEPDLALLRAACTPR